MSEAREPARIEPPWSRRDRVARALLGPLQAFIAQETSSGILLLGAVIVALIWANSPWHASYERLWGTLITIRTGRGALSEDLVGWIDDLLMALFFFVVGLEIKREALTGELRDRRAALVPAVAALGGMVVPALLYLAITAGSGNGQGWGVPMATDIAFALGLLALVGQGLPSAIRAFLLTLAIVDDLGAIVVIAVFYSGAVDPLPLGIAAGLLLLAWGLIRLRIHAGPLYGVLAAGVWLGTFASGVHATIAGVALAMIVPATPFQRPGAVSAEAHRIADMTEDHPDPPDADADAWMYLAHLSRAAVSPLTRLETALHPWTSLVIVPLFALANAGVRISAPSLRDALTSRVTIGIVVGLVVGKLVGVTGATGLVVASRVGRLPADVGSRDIVGLGAAAGIGFTIALFIADLAFPEARSLRDAKVGILIGSVLSATVGAVLLLVARRRRLEPPSADPASI